VTGPRVPGRPVRPSAGFESLQLTDSLAEMAVLLRDEDREGNKALELIDRVEGARARGVLLLAVGTVRLETVRVDGAVGIETLGERGILVAT
jgi:hypothetical protein